MPETKPQNESQILEEILANLKGINDEQRATIRMLRDALKEREKELHKLKTELEKRTTSLARAEEDLELRTRAYKDFKTLQDVNKASNQRVQNLEYVVEDAKSKIDFYYQVTRETARALDTQRDRRISRLIERFFDHTDVFSVISPPLRQIKDDTLIFNTGLKGFNLRPSRSLQKVSYLAYQVKFNRPGLAEILIAPIIDVPITTGTVGLELVSPANKIVAQSTCPADEITGFQPVHLKFDPLYETKQGTFELRVFVRDIDAPLRLYEWQKYTLFGFGPLLRKAFCGFEFIS